MGSIGQRIKEEQEKAAAARRKSLQLAEEAFLTSSERARAQHLIPIIDPLIKELVKTVRFHITESSSRHDNDYRFEEVLKKYVVSRREKSGWFSSKAGRPLFTVCVGSISVSVRELVVRVCPLYIIVHNVDDISENFGFDSIPNSEPEIKEWFSDILVRTYTRYAWDDF